MSDFFKDLIQWFADLFGVVFPATVPSKVPMVRILDNNASQWGVSAMVKAKCGLLVCTYNRETRTNAAIDLVNPDTGASRNLIRTGAETFGRPVLRDGKWYFPQESKEGIVIIDDNSGAVLRGRAQPQDYSTCGIDDFFPICPRGGGIPQLWNYRTNEMGHKYKHLNGIVSAIIRDRGGYCSAVQDGGTSGVEWQDGQFVNIPASGLEKVGGRLLAFCKNGDIRDVTGAKAGATKAKIGKKFVRATSNDGLAWGVTANPDALVCTNGDDVRIVFEFSGNVNDGTSSGSLFDGDCAVEGKRVWVARSLNKGGFEVWKGKV